MCHSRHVSPHEIYHHRCRRGQSRRTSGACLYQGFLPCLRELLDPPFDSQRQAPRADRPREDQPERPPPSQVSRAPAVAPRMLRDSPAHVRRYPGVERPVAAPHDIDGPLRHGRTRCPAPPAARPCPANPGGGADRIQPAIHRSVQGLISGGKTPGPPHRMGRSSSRRSPAAIARIFLPRLKVWRPAWRT